MIRHVGSILGLVVVFAGAGASTAVSQDPVREAAMSLDSLLDIRVSVASKYE